MIVIPDLQSSLRRQVRLALRGHARDIAKMEFFDRALHFIGQSRHAQSSTQNAMSVLIGPNRGALINQERRSCRLDLDTRGQAPGTSKDIAATDKCQVHLRYPPLYVVQPRPSVRASNVETIKPC